MTGTDGEGDSIRGHQSQCLGNRSLLSRASDRIGILLGAAACLIPLFWFNGNTIIQVADFSDPINPSMVIGSILSGWTGNELGQPTFRDAPLLFPFEAFWDLGKAIGLSTAVTQRLWFVTLFIFGYFSALYLIKTVTKSRLPGWYIAPSIALLFLFNPYTLSQWASGHDLLLLAYYASPLWLAAVYKLLYRPTFSLGYAFLVACISLLYASSFNDLAVDLTYIGIPTVLLLAAALWKRDVLWREALKRLGSTGLLIVGVNLWWIVPMLTHIQGGYSYAGSSQNVLAWPNLSVPVSFFEFLRGMGFWAFYGSYQGTPYYSYQHYLTSPEAIIATSLIMLVVPLALLLAKKTEWALFAVALYLLGVDLGSALNGPLGFVNRWMYLHLPGFFLFRSAYEKFEGLAFLGLVISAAVLFTLKFSRRSRILGISCLLAATVVGSAPMFTGAIAMKHSTSIDVKVPAYYPALLKWTTNIEQKWPGSMLVLPQLGYVKTTWGIEGVDVLPEYSAVPTVTGQPGATLSDSPQIEAIIEAGSYYTNASFLRRLGIDLVLVRSDLDVSYYPGTPTGASLAAQLKRAHFLRVATFGAFEIFAVPGASSGVDAFNSVGSLPHMAQGVNGILSTSPTVNSGIAGPGVKRVCLPQVVALGIDAHSVKVTCSGSSHVITVRGVSSSNQLLSDGTFAKTLWSGSTWAGGAPSRGILALRVTGPGGRGTAVQLESSGGHAAVLTTVKGIFTDTVFRLTLKYEHVTGAAPSLVLLEPDTETTLASVELKASPGWHKATVFAEATPGSSVVDVFLYADALSGGHTVERYSDVVLSDVIVPGGSIVPVKMRTVPLALETRNVGISSTSIHGTIRGVNGTAWLVLPNAYNSNWHLALSAKHGRVAVLRHVVVDGFQNGWQISGSGDISFVASFGSSWLVPVLCFLSGFFVLTGWCLVIMRRRRRRAPNSDAVRQLDDGVAPI